MEHHLDIAMATKPERTPKSEDRRSKKKVRTHDDHDLHVDMDSKDYLGIATEDHQNWPTLSRQLFTEATPEPNHSPTPPAQAKQPTTSSAETHPQPQASFKDKLVGGGTRGEPLPEVPPEELLLDDDDVTISTEELVPSISFSQRVQDIMTENMRYTVVVKVLGRFVRYTALYTKISALWKPSSGFRLIELDEGCFLVKLFSNDDYQNALLGGPWVVMGHYLTVHPWEPTISPQNLEIENVYGWVRLPSLPYHYYHKSVLRAVGDLIGDVQKIDYNTSDGTKARFARLAVKINLTKPPCIQSHPRWGHAVCGI